MIGGGDLSHALADGLAARRTSPDAPVPDGTTEVVIVIGDAPAPAEPVEAMSSDRWHRDVDAPIASVLAILATAKAAMSAGGRIVFVVPTIGVAGAPGLVGYTTAGEGIRAMAKSAARQWASEGIGVNMVAVPVRIIAPELASADAHLTAPALGRDVDLFATVTSAVAVLLDRDLDHLAGATLVVDGGSVMTP